MGGGGGYPLSRNFPWLGFLNTSLILCHHHWPITNTASHQPSSSILSIVIFSCSAHRDLKLVCGVLQGHHLNTVILSSDHQNIINQNFDLRDNDCSDDLVDLQSPSFFALLWPESSHPRACSGRWSRNPGSRCSFARLKILAWIIKIVNYPDDLGYVCLDI